MSRPSCLCMRWSLSCVLERRIRHMHMHMSCTCAHVHVCPPLPRRRHVRHDVWRADAAGGSVPEQLAPRHIKRRAGRPRFLLLRRQELCVRPFDLKREHGLPEGDDDDEEEEDDE